jgi:hypothetical protein
MRAVSKLAATLGAAAIALTLVVPAAAYAPTTIEEQFTRVLTNHCPDFAIRSTFFVDRRVTTFYDADGTAIRQVIYGIFPGQVENVSTGYTLPAENVRIVSIDLLTGESRSTGTNVRVFLPGGPTIQVTAGIQIRDATGTIILDGGRLDQAPTPELCEALAAG